MRNNFNIAEILKSVDVIVSDNRYEAYDKNKIINRYKRFANKNINMSDNPKTEKIIIDAEESLKNKDSENNSEKIERSPLILNTVTSSNLDLSEPLILEKEFIEEERNLEDYDLTESVIDENELLKSENIKQEEIIKDLNILLYNFKKQKVYSGLYNKIKLYQEDNASLRKKIFNLSEAETHLRLRLSELTLDKQVLTLDKQVDKEKVQTFEESAEAEKEEIEKLNIQIKNLSQKNNQLQSELLSLKKDKEYHSTDINQKIKFYREEYAKIIVDKSDVQRKLEISKNQLLVNEKNKIELKLALENLNQILSSSNIETRAFTNENEKDKKLKEDYKNKFKPE